jgi:hypothetical protein
VSQFNYCRICGCTEQNACLDERATEAARQRGEETNGIGCHWIVRPTAFLAGICNVCHEKSQQAAGVPTTPEIDPTNPQPNAQEVMPIEQTTGARS